MQKLKYFIILFLLISYLIQIDSYVFIDKIEL